MAITSNYGAAPTFVKIASQTLTGTSSTVTFSNIPQGYTDLQLVINYAISNAAGTDVRMQFNGDTGTNYSALLMSGKNAQAPSNDSARRSNVNYIQFNNWVGPINTYTNYAVVNVMSYSNSTFYKTAIHRGGQFQGSYHEVITQTALYRSTAPITSIAFYTTSYAFAAGATFTIYGIKAALVPKASGGDIIVQDGSYWYHTFRNTGAFVPKQSLTCDYLVVAGGGSGGSGGMGGGGGGAGGLRSTVTATGGGGSLESALSLTAQAYTVTVGAGGAAASNALGNNGNNSVFSTITSTGGGGGSNGVATGVVGNTGGSGGGSAGRTAAVGGSGTANQGFAGGAALGTAGDGAAGGGGAGAAATAVTVNGNATNGGAGVATSISGSSVTYGGGGGGGTGASGGTRGTGGSGGGGNGGLWYGSAGSAGTANTGGGGGGSADSGITSYAGGSGIVIVRYPI